MILDFSKAVELPDELIDLIYYSEHNVTWNGIETYHLNDEVPAAWDSTPSIKGDYLEIHGGFGPSGYGSVSVSIPKKDVNTYYRFELEWQTPKDDLDENDEVEFYKVKNRIIELLIASGVAMNKQLD